MQTVHVQEHLNVSAYNHACAYKLLVSPYCQSQFPLHTFQFLVRSTIQVLITISAVLT